MTIPDLTTLMLRNASLCLAPCLPLLDEQTAQLAYYFSLPYYRSTIKITQQSLKKAKNQKTKEENAIFTFCFNDQVLSRQMFYNFNNMFLRKRKVNILKLTPSKSFYTNVIAFSNFLEVAIVHKQNIFFLQLIKSNCLRIQSGFDYLKTI